MPGVRYGAVSGGVGAAHREIKKNETKHGAVSGGVDAAHRQKLKLLYIDIIHTRMRARACVLSILFCLRHATH